MHYRTFKPAFMLAALLVAGAANAQEAASADDNINPDRPDFVESSAVVGKGRFQVETSFGYERGSRDGVRERQTATPTLLRFGISDTAEFRVETDGWVHSWTRGADTSDATGMADTSLGIKWRLQEGKDGAPALGVLVDAALPTGASRLGSGGVRPSLRGVAEWELPQDFSLAAMPGLAVQRSDAGQRFTSGIFAVSLGKEFNERVHGFVELAAPQIAHARDGGTQLSFDFGAAYLINKNVQVDAALFRGLNHNTPDVSVSVGLSFRL
ncbi:MAG: transporter [Massilia sp.]